MSLWMVRAGRHGEWEELALEKGVVVIVWELLGDLSTVRTKDELREKIVEAYPGKPKGWVSNLLGQLWGFIREIKMGDLVGLPMKKQASIAIGKVEGDYEYKVLTEMAFHVRKVKWLRTIPRSEFDQDLLYSFGAIMTVCRIERNDAENRVKMLLSKEIKEEGQGKPALPPEIVDVEAYSKDQIVKYIAEKFKGHDLARLVDAALKAQGYITRVSPPGPDGGVDILAASGPLGFDRPRICVQVKSGASQVDVRVLRELIGVMSKVKADQGLLVSWSGFNSKAIQEARDQFFDVRLWDSGDLLEAVFKYYDKFSDELRAELPLKRIYALVLEEE